MSKVQVRRCVPGSTLFTPRATKAVDADFVNANLSEIFHCEQRGEGSPLRRRSPRPIKNTHTTLKFVLALCLEIGAPDLVSKKEPQLKPNSEGSLFRYGSPPCYPGLI